MTTDQRTAILMGKKRERCSKCGQLLPKPYKPRPVCKCGAKRWTQWYTDKGIELECTKCGRRVKP